MTFFLLAVEVLVSLAVLYLLILAAVCKFSVSPPRMPQFVTPGLMGEQNETVTIETPDGEKLRAWWVPCAGKTTVVFAHGYFTNRCEFVPFVTRFRDRGASCLLFDHRAHGTSTGKRCTFGIEETLDVASAVAWVQSKRPDDKIVLVGNSMGALACALMCENDPDKIAALVLDSPYATVAEGAAGWWTFFARGRFKGFLRPTAIFGRLFTGVDLKSIDLEPALEKIESVPTLIMFGCHDPLISREKMDACIKAAGPLAEVVWFSDSNHARARFREPERYSEALFGFLERHGLLTAPDSSRERSSACVARDSASCRIDHVES